MNVRSRQSRDKGLYLTPDMMTMKENAKIDTSHPTLTSPLKVFQAFPITCPKSVIRKLILLAL